MSVCFGMSWSLMQLLIITDVRSLACAHGRQLPFTDASRLSLKSGRDAWLNRSQAFTKHSGRYSRINLIALQVRYAQCVP